jgi:pSer/pThr/pTyr-binding forkhead associated (FHA) protein
MPIVAVNIIKVAFVVALYGFLFYVARSMRGHVAGPPLDAAPSPAQSAAQPPRSPAATPDASGERSIDLVDASGSTTSHPMRGAVVVGRGASADIQIDDDFASEQHARFVLEGSSITVEDLDSTNGTTIDGVLIEGRVEVVPGTAVILGRTRVVIT